MIARRMIFALLLCGSVLGLHAGEISLSDTGSFKLTSRTSFGIDLDNTYRYGLDQELTDFQLILNLVPYQKLSNLVNSPNAVGFVNLTLFHLDLIATESIGYNPGIDDENGDNAYLTRNRYQTGEFAAGIAKGNWIIQMNAGANEPFWSPWNKGLQFVNDKVKFTWAYLDSMVDVKRTALVSTLKPQDPVVSQFKQDGPGETDGLGLAIGGPTVAVMFNKEESFGFNVKVATEYGYDSNAITETNRNGLAGGVDYVTTPKALPGLKIFASLGGSSEYGLDKNDDPLMGGTKIGYTIPLNEDISVEPYVGTDLGTEFRADGSAGIGYFEIAGGLTMRWPGQGGWYTDYILNEDGRVFPGMSVAYKVLGKSDLEPSEYSQNVKFTLFEPKADEGVFYGIGSEMIVDAYNILSEDRYFLGTFYLDYSKAGVFNSSGSLIPWVTLCYDNIPDGNDRLQSVKVDTGVKLDGVITNTMIGLTWNSGDVLEEDAAYRFGYLKATCEIRY